MMVSLQSWFYPRSTGDISRDRNARTLQFSLLLFVFALGAIAALDVISGARVPTPILIAALGLAAAVAANRQGKPAWARQTFILVLTLGATLLVAEARDGFRSHAMLVFPGLLLISVMLFNRRAYVITAAGVLLIVAGLGIAEIWGLTRAIPGVRTISSYYDIFYVDLILTIFAVIGIRIVNDIQGDVVDLRISIGQLSAAHIDLTKTAEALRESEERWRLASKATLDAIWDIDLKTGRVSWNHTYADLYGRPPETSSSWQWWIDNIHPEDRERTASDLRAAIESNTSSWVSEYRFQRVDGEWAHIYDRAYIAHDSSGRACRVVGAMQDLTERKQAEKALKTSEEKYRALVETTGTGYLIIDRDGQVIDANQEYVRLTGHPDLGQILGRSVMGWTAVYEKQKNVEALARCVRDGFVRDFVIDYVDGSSHITPIEINATVVGCGETLRIISLCRDITERKRAEADLREKEHLLSQSQRIAHIGSWSFDLNSGAVVWTDEAYAIYGVSPGVFIPSIESLLGLIHPDDRRAMQEWIGATAAGHFAGYLEFRAVRPDGSLRILSGQGEMAAGNDTRTRLMVGTVQDITGRKLAEEERENLHAQLTQAQKMESIGRFAGGIAHDFSNLMSIILLHSDSASQELSQGDPLMEPLNEIRKAAERAVAMTQQLMAFSRKRAVETELLNLSSVIAECEKLVRRLIGEDIRLVFISGSELGSVNGDRGQLSQVMMNLAVNSRDAMPHGGTLTIETANVEVDEADSSVNPGARPGSYVMIAFRDTGVGMDKETQARVFEPFFTTKEVGKGTGLGLSMVYGIVKQSGGYVTVQSEPGRGAEFKIYLPRILKVPEQVPAAGATVGQRGVETILVVEDEPALREPICRLLEDAGYRVLAGKDVGAAIQIAKQHAGSLDLLLTDVVMPDLSGPQLKEQLRPLHPRMRVLYMSGYPEPRQAGSDLPPEMDLIQKPFTRQKLLSRLREVLDSSGPSS
jgi:PAS domain S-box-containing protein